MAAKMKYSKCVVRKPISTKAFVVVGAAAVGPLIYPQNAPVAAAAATLITLIALTIVHV